MSLLARTASAAMLVVILTSFGATQGPSTVTTTSGNACPPSDADGRASISWVPFVRVNGLSFHATFDPQATVAESQLEETVATVACTISESVRNPHYRPRDGDAAFLPAGTELRAIKDYRRDFRLAAWEDGAWRVYEVDDVPDATTGEDLLDLRDKVVRVHLVEGDRGEKILKTVDNQSEVTTIVEAVLAAPVLPDTPKLYDRLGNEPVVFVRFDLPDGTSVQRAWHRKAGVLWRRIKAPDELRQALSPPPT